MAVPVIFGIAALGSLIGDALQGAGQKQAADAQAQADEENARLLRMRASDVLRESQRQAGQVRSAGSQAIAGQKLAFTASGVDASSGTAANLAAYSRAQSEIDALISAANGTKQAMGLKTQAAQLERHAGASRTAGDWALAGSLIGGAGRAAGMAYNYLRQPQVA